MTGVIAVVATCSIAVAGLGSVYAARAQAVAAADGAALAAAVATYPPAAEAPPIGSARAVADLNGARLVECVCPVDAGPAVRTVTVVVAVRTEVPVFGVLTVRASSRAEFDPMRWLGR